MIIKVLQDKKKSKGNTFLQFKNEGETELLYKKLIIIVVNY